ncbi:VOC family protein [Catenuloplanes japonicus]|uniref:VOC family protein n=1 Tax=Catenuloplanes japonicus TaxID=33876 RepID=UPI000526FFC9|nr:VOC family protein [Catenuloplanes japonicus]
MIADAHLRIARPARDLEATARFYTEGLGLEVLFRKEGLMMVGAPGARWHLELVAGETVPSPTEEDLLVLYLDGPVDDARLVAAGGRRVAQGEYWDRWGVTVADPDGYRLVLSTRAWSNCTRNRGVA